MVSQNNPLKSRYILHEKLGQGGAADIFRATHIHLDREVALKFLRNEVLDEVLKARFQQEAKSIARLNHPNILQVYDFDLTDDGRFFMAMEYLASGDLNTYIAQRVQAKRPLNLAESIFIIKSVAEGLHHAHNFGIIHRDVKPSNIFMVNEERVVIGDFGVAKLMDEDIQQTEKGQIVGTPRYLAPEQLLGGEIDRRTDIYALGIVFFQLITGQYPYNGEDIKSVMDQHIHSPIPAPTHLQPSLPISVNKVIQLAMAKAPEDRYSTMREFVDDLNLIQQTLREGVTERIPIPYPKGSMKMAQTTQPSYLSSLSPDAQTMVFPKPRRIKPILVGVGILLVLLLPLIIPMFISSSNPLTTAITPAAPNELVILVSKMYDDETRVNIGQRLYDQLSNSIIKVVLQDRIRFETLNGSVTSAQEAKQTAQTVGAKLVIWGTHDASGWEIIIQAPHREGNELQRLRLKLSNSDNQATILSESVPEAAEYFVKILLMSDLIRQSDLFSTLYLSFNMGSVDESVRALASTALDEQIISFFDLMYGQNFVDADTTLSDALQIAPSDRTLLFLRWTVNIFRNERELTERSANRLGSYEDSKTFAIALRLAGYYLFGDMASLLAHESDMSLQRNTASITASSFIYQAKIQYGDFAAALKNITDNRAWMAQENYYPQGSNYFDILVLLLNIQGDDVSLAQIMPDYQESRSERFRKEGNQYFRAIKSNNYAPVAFAIGGYGEEVDEKPSVAQLTYLFGLLTYPDDYLLNWREAGIEVQKEVYTSAYARYDASIVNAPVPFPIARYDQAMLVLNHGDEIENPRSVCDLLADALALAQTDTTFYTVLIGRIGEAQQTASCSA